MQLHLQGSTTSFLQLVKAIRLMANIKISFFILMDLKG